MFHRIRHGLSKMRNISLWSENHRFKPHSGSPSTLGDSQRGYEKGVRVLGLGHGTVIRNWSGSALTCFYA